MGAIHSDNKNVGNNDRSNSDHTRNDPGYLNHSGDDDQDGRNENDNEAHNLNNLDDNFENHNSGEHNHPPKDLDNPNDIEAHNATLEDLNIDPDDIENIELNLSENVNNLIDSTNRANLENVLDLNKLADSPNEVSNEHHHKRHHRHRRHHHRHRIIETIEIELATLKEPVQNVKDKVEKVVHTVGDELSPEMDLEVLQSADLVHHPIQTLWSVFRRVLIPFIISGLGQVIAGVIMNTVTKWKVFQEIPHLTVMISPFLGMITNIKSTLASRMSAQANTGSLDSWTELRHFLAGNLKVVQCQATVASLFTAIGAVAVSALKPSTRSKITWKNSLVVCSSSVSTSVLANSILTSLIGLLIIVARKCGVNTDSHLCTLIVSAIRDICSISLLALISAKLSELDNTYLQLTLLSPTLISPVIGYFARKNRFTKSAIIYGWPAMLLGVMLEQPGGLVMEGAFEDNQLASALQPLMNGVARNMMGIQAGHLTNNLQSALKTNRGVMPKMKLRQIIGPFCSKDSNSKMSHLLLAIMIPAQLFYMSVVYIIQARYNFTIHLTFPFVASFMAAVLIQVFIILNLSHVTVFVATKFRYDPDNSAVPLMSAFNNLIGNCALASMFAFLRQIKDPNVDDLMMMIMMQHNGGLNVTINENKTSLVK